jgi:hypothetical protein
MTTGTTSLVFASEVFDVCRCTWSNGAFAMSHGSVLRYEALGEPKTMIPPPQFQSIQRKKLVSVPWAKILRSTQAQFFSRKGPVNPRAAKRIVVIDGF